MPLQATSGAASYDAFGGGAAAVPNYIEDVFSTYLYTGTGESVTQRIASGIDIATKGGMVWTKTRAVSQIHQIFDTARGERKYLRSNATDAEFDSGANSVQYKTSGWDAFAYVNETNVSFASWTFRKQPKFFDVVTYTGNGGTNNIAHNLQSIPGCIIIKSTSASANWAVISRDGGGLMYYHYFSKNTNGLNSTGAGTGPYDSTAAINATTFNAGALQDTGGSTNQNGVTYVAYLFAHNAGGFGLTGTDNVISCSTFEANNGEVINLGYEPQWLLYKDVSSTSNWRMVDIMRGFNNLSGTNAQTTQQLLPNSSNAEAANSGPVLTSTGFTWNQSGGGNKHIYIAIRRGPMKVPTSGTSVFTPISNTSPATGCLTDMVIARQPTGTQNTWNISRLTNAFLQTNTTAAETANASYLNFDTMSGVVNAGFLSDSNSIWWNFRRAPSFFDEVCYTGTGANASFTHNLGAVPELMIVKRRSAGGAWMVNSQYIAADARLELQSTSAVKAPPDYGDAWNNTRPTSTVFTVSTDSDVNASGGTYVNYLFATCAGVSKCFNYTGNGSSQTINCGFTGGARWILIKRTDSTGDWYCWDSARGIVSGNDPHLSLNTTAAEVTSDDTIDTDSTGFVVNQVSATNVNVSSATYIGIAIA